MVARDIYFKVLDLAIFCLSVRFTLQLSLHEHRTVSSRLGIASYSQLFFIGRLLNRTPDQSVIIGIKVDIPYRRSSVFVKLHIRRYCFKYFLFLFEREHIF